MLFHDCKPIVYVLDAMMEQLHNYINDIYN